MKLLYLLLVALVCLAVPTVSDNPHCYICSNNLGISNVLGIYYDPNCNKDNYNGHTQRCEDDPCECMTVIHANDDVERHWSLSPFHFDECKEEDDKTTCYCHGEKCNNNLCDHCNLPTAPPTDPTTDPTTVPTMIEPPVMGITCYDCQNYNKDWDNFDVNCNDSSYAGASEFTYLCTNCESCFTEVNVGGQVTRGEAGAFEDGECHEGVDEIQGSYTRCYCIHDMCNSNLCENCPSM